MAIGKATGGEAARMAAAGKAAYMAVAGKAAMHGGGWGDDNWEGGEAARMAAAGKAAEERWQLERRLAARRIEWRRLGRRQCMAAAGEMAI